MNPFKFNFVKESFNFNFNNLIELKRKIDDEWVLLRNSGLVDLPIKETELKKQKQASEIFTRTCHIISDHKIKNILDLLETVETVEKARIFTERLNVPPRHLKEMIWKIEDILPYKKPLKAAIIPENKAHLRSLAQLKGLKITNNLTLLDIGRTSQGRERLIEETAIPLEVLLELIHRADFLRGSHVSGRTIDHFFEAGYDTVDKIKERDTSKIINDFRKYEESSGKPRKDKIVFGFVIYVKHTPKVFLS
jgi:hypothetical protein